MKLHNLIPAALLALGALASCGGPSASAGSEAATGRLPYIGEAERVAVPGHDTLTRYPTVPAFRLRDQDGHLLTNQSLAGKVYVTDFFFATCPGICPKEQGEMLKVYKQYAANPRVVFLSHTIDPAHDTQPVLLDYARRLTVPAGANWRFARTSRDSAYALARAYFTGAMPDKAAPGGIAHNGTFALVDDQGHVRGLYDSLNPQQIALLLHDMPILLAEVQARSSQPATASR
ncbi:MAG: SCO family protein [Janthinobacterium lividum]